ncbi:hypothetical protein GQ457_17G004710 [Hibiscus cannabinus]
MRENVPEIFPKAHNPSFFSICLTARRWPSPLAALSCPKSSGPSHAGQSRNGVDVRRGEPFEASAKTHIPFCDFGHHLPSVQVTVSRSRFPTVIRAKPVVEVSVSTPSELSPELSFVYFVLGSSRSVQSCEPVITGSSTVAERSRYLLDRSELLFQVVSVLGLFAKAKGGTLGRYPCLRHGLMPVLQNFPVLNLRLPFIEPPPRIGFGGQGEQNPVLAHRSDAVCSLVGASPNYLGFGKLGSGDQFDHLSAKPSSSCSRTRSCCYPLLHRRRAFSPDQTGNPLRPKASPWNPKDRLISWGMVVDGTCVMCGEALESRNHILFSCSGTKAIWSEVLLLCNTSRGSLNWDQEVEFGIKLLRGKSLIVLVLRLAWSAYIYFVWNERNCRIFQHTVGHISGIMSSIREVVHSRLSGKFINCNDFINAQLGRNWGFVV